MSNIKINDVYQRIQYSAALNQTVFIVPYPFFQNNYLFVWVNGIELNEGGAPGQYTVAGAGSPSGGTVTLITPSVNGDIITIEGKMPIDRTSIYSATISNLTGSDLNGDFNREVVMMKQIETVQDLLQIQYAPWALVSQDVDVTRDRYIPILPAGYGWRMNMAGTEIESVSIPDGGYAPDSATYITQTPSSGLPNSQAMSALASGFVVNTTATGVQITRDFEGTANQILITNQDGISGNPAWSIAPDVVLPGVQGIGLIRGTTAQRPVTPGSNNFFRFNTDVKFLEYWNNTSWIQLVEDAGVLIIHGTANQINVDSTDPAEPIISLPSTLIAPGTIQVGNMLMSGNTLSITNVNGHLDLLANGTGQVLLNNSTPVAITGIPTTVGINSTASGALTLTRFVNNGGSSGTVYMKSRGATINSHAAVQSSDLLGVNYFYGDDGTTYDTLAGAMVVQVSGAVSTGIIPTSMIFSTMTTAGVLNAALTISNTQVVTLFAPLPLGSGGSNANLTASNGGIVYSTASAMAILAGNATANRLLLSGASSAPAWSTSTYPLTNAVNTLLYASSANVMAALATANSGVLVTSAGGVPSISTTLPNMAHGTPTSITLTNGAGLPIAGITGLGTGVATALAANTLGAGGIALETDGTFTPTITFGGAAVGLTYAQQNGVYRRIGNHIAFTLTVQLSAVGSSTGAALISGLPTAQAAGATFTCFSMVPGLTYTGTPIAFLSAGSSAIGLQTYSTSGVPANITNTNFTASSILIISGMYPI